jgi:hypothetical protein
MESTQSLGPSFKAAGVNDLFKELAQMMEADERNQDELLIDLPKYGGPDLFTEKYPDNRALELSGGDDDARGMEMTERENLAFEAYMRSRQADPHVPAKRK